MPVLIHFRITPRVCCFHRNTKNFMSNEKEKEFAD